MSGTQFTIAAVDAKASIFVCRACSDDLMRQFYQDPDIYHSILNFTGGCVWWPRLTKRRKSENTVKIHYIRVFIIGRGYISAHRLIKQVDAH